MPAPSTEAGVVVFSPLKITVKSSSEVGVLEKGGVPPFSYLCVNSVSVAANHLPTSQPVNVMTRPWQNLKTALDFVSFRRNNAKGFPGYLNINDSGAFNCQWGPSLRNNRQGTGELFLMQSIIYPDLQP